MQLSDFDFDLPDNLIATRPVRPRSAAKMLVAQGDSISDVQVYNLPDILKPGDLLVLNDTKVIPARLTGIRTRATGHGPVSAKIEVTLLEPQKNGVWTALVKPLRKWHIGERVVFSDSLSAVLIRVDQGQAHLAFDVADGDLDAALDQTGTMPLPPYIASKRAADAQDASDYQTIWARHRGAVAAPTASLHFDDMVMDALRQRGVHTAFVTLHVGAGTFLPVKVDDIATHKMHAEWGHVSRDTVRMIQNTKAKGGRVIAVGTTALRVLETAAQSGPIQPWEGDTDIFIYPGFDFHVVDGLMTNFHLPQSTLLMLVSALMGKPRMDRIYAHAIANRYRFFSYGDASLLLPK
ncbi:MAG: tRNA preQ1(34) S-adenosylmethionine ribosyltransferase-isomerase QueA [Pseudomonadota bacterium]